MTTSTTSTRKLKTHCKKGHELVEGNLVTRLLPSRRCLTCYASSPHYSRPIYSGFDD